MPAKLVVVTEPTVPDTLNTPVDPVSTTFPDVPDVVMEF